MNGKVYLIGAGPGDPKLITQKGIECIKKADVILYDFLASPKLLDYADKKAEIIYVGKKGGDHTLPQDKINELIVKKAKSGLKVARLKGGDPFIFGRGGEEIEEIVEAGIDFEVVSGVTSAIAAAAYAGIPLTHRSYTSTVAFITGHEDFNKKESSINWELLAKGIKTLVFLMGVKNLSNIVDKLISNEMDPNTPVGIIRWGTTPSQKTITGTLANIIDVANQEKIKPPSIILVGEVVKLREKLQWFENKALFGKKIVVTRARHQASELTNKLTDMGADCIECPTIKIVKSDEIKNLDEAFKHIKDYQWLIFTSVNGVSIFFDYLFEKGYDVRLLNNIRIATIGPSTANKLREFGLISDIVPKTYQAESVIEAFKNEDIEGKKILIPRAKEARPILVDELKKTGAIVDEISIYETIKDNKNIDLLLELLENKEIDLITFTSSSTVKNFKSMFTEKQFKTLLDGVNIASIGPITTETAEDLGFKVDITAKDFTIDGLCDAIVSKLNIL